jgi:hypothetical protein
VHKSGTVCRPSSCLELTFKVKYVDTSLITTESGDSSCIRSNLSERELLDSSRVSCRRYAAYFQLTVRIRFGVRGGRSLLRHSATNRKVAGSIPHGNFSLTYPSGVLFGSMGVRGKPRVAYCTARFGRSNFGHQMLPRLPTRSAL